MEPITSVWVWNLLYATLYFVVLAGVGVLIMWWKERKSNPNP